MAQQTGLDTTGIPCYAAIRPNSKTLAVHQGKGSDDDAARLSAIMEAVEFSIAESPQADTWIGSVEQLRASDQDLFVRGRSLPHGHAVPRGAELIWIAGQCMASGKRVLVPRASVALSASGEEPLPFSQSSNGLGAGFSKPEATVHAFCELIERDASTLWSMRSLDRCTEAVIDVAGLADRDARRTVEKVRDAGFQVIAFDLTTDLGLPTVMALLWSGAPRTYFDVASGVCSHPSAARALTGAIEEAAQTRVSNIAGSRDDIGPDEYDRLLPDWIGKVIRSNAQGSRSLPPDMLPHDFAGLPERLEGRNVVVPLSHQDDRISVVKVLSETLEDRSTNRHWRPGRRAVRAMTQP